MKKKNILFLLLIGLTACKQEYKTQTDALPISYLSQINSDHPVCPDQIRAIIRSDYLTNGDNAVWDSVAQHYYANTDRFLWLHSGGRKQIESLLLYLNDARRHGLESHVFHTQKIEREIERLKLLDFEAGQTINHSLAAMEYHATKAYMHYVCGMTYGFINPNELLNNLEADDDIKYAGKLIDGKKKMKTLYQIPLKICTPEYAASVMSDLITGAAEATLRSVQPDSPFYTGMQAEMDAYLPLAGKCFEQIPDMGDVLIKEGESHPSIPYITHRLLLTGELDAAAADTANFTLTPELLKAVNAFRVKNRLPEDNAIGSFSVRALNNPMSYYLDRLRVNLERARWQYALEKGDKYIVVNTAAFMLKAVDETTDSIIEMRICCGTSRNKTPLLSSKIYYFELNPYWNVPQSIIKKEIIPAYRRDTTYFTRQRMKVYDLSGDQINPHHIKWSNYKGTVPFTVKQDNREGNSLGRIIFRFPNSFAVYLHDTPVRSAFLRTNRAVSHGCVRLERAVDFAFFLLDQPNPVVEDRIRVATGLKAQSEEGKKLTQQDGYKDLENYNLKVHIPLYIDYQTMYLAANGVLTYCEDTYKYDAILLTALEQLNKDGQ